MPLTAVIFYINDLNSLLFLPSFISEEIVITESPELEVEICEGDILRLEVKAKGHPYPRYQWFFCPDGEEKFQRLQGYKESTLTIRGVR